LGTDAPFNLVKKCSRITKEIGAVEKNGHNTYDKYHYATDGDIFNAVNRATAQYDVFILFEPLTATITMEPYTTASNKASTKYRFDAEMKIMDGDSDMVIASKWPCIAYDMSDKGFGKALTLGLKYALKTTFKIDTGDRSDDPDSQSAADVAPRTDQRPQNGKQHTQLPKDDTPPGMKGRTFNLKPELQSTVLRIYKTADVPLKAPVDRHQALLKRVFEQTGGEGRIPWWWDKFKPETLSGWLDAHEKPKAEHQPAKQADPPDDAGESDADKESAFGRLLKSYGWNGKDRPDDAMMRRGIHAVAAAEGINIEDASMNPRTYSLDAIERAFSGVK
jgi:ERF superfamily